MSSLFYLPHANRPGTDRMSKAVARNPQVIDLMASTIFNVEAGIYRVDESEWANGTRSDLVLIPDVINDEQRPLIVEFQKTVDKKFIKRAISYCLQANSRYDIDPVMLIFCIDTVAESTEEKFENSIRLPCCATIPCDFWATECLILSKKTIKQHINVEGSLNPLIALGMFLTYQASAITLLPRCEDPTLIFLYEIAKKSFQEMYYRDVLISEELNNLCDTQLQDYKNMLSTIQTEEEPLHTITEQIQKKIKQINQKKRLYDDMTTENILTTAPTITTSSRDVYKEGMEFVDTFKKERDKSKKRMDWKSCLSKGLKEGFLFGYKNTNSLRVQFTKYKNNEAAN